MLRASRQRPLLTVAALALAALPASCRSCAPPDDRTRIEQLLEAGAEAAEAHDTTALFALTTPDLVTKPEQLDRAAAQELVGQVFRSYGAFTLHRPQPKLEIDAPAGEAWVRTPFVLLKPGGPFTIPEVLRADPLAWLERVAEHVDPYHLELWLTRSAAGTWRVREVHIWGPGGPD